MRGPVLKPVDEGAKDASFAAFRKKLLEAVRRRDSEFVLGVVHPGIRNTFGMDDGLRLFREKWQPERADSALWAELETILTAGGKFRIDRGSKRFWAPYAYAAEWPKGFDDPFSAHSAIMGKDVRLRAAPRADAAVVALLTYNIVETLGEPVDDRKGGKWVKVCASTGLEGYVAGQYVRHPLDYRAAFTKIDGRWMMTALVAGD